MRSQRRQRRATVLLIVVSLLALLFVIITGFLTLSRNERITLQEFKRGEATDSILENEKERVLRNAAHEITDANGKVLSGPGSQYEQVPGVGASSYIAATPVTSESVNVNAETPGVNNNDFVTDFPWGSGIPGWTRVEYERFKKFVYPTLSKLDPQPGDRPSPLAVWQLLLENELDSGIDAGRLSAADIDAAARDPFMDADGDGIPDSWWIYQWPAIEEANAAAGAPIKLTGLFSPDGSPLNDLRPNSIPPYIGNPGSALGDAIHNAYVRYRETRRFDVASVVRSHGGMITLHSPRVLVPPGRPNDFKTPWNRDFVMSMFDAFRSPADLGGQYPPLRYYSLNEQNYIFDQLAGSSASVEPSLRRRGGLAPAPLGAGRIPNRAVPGILAALQGEAPQLFRGFPATFVPRFNIPAGNGRLSPGKENLWDRFNLSRTAINGASDRLAAVMSKQLSVTEQLENELTGPGPNQPVSLNSPKRSRERRQELTTISTSDEIARKILPGDAQPVLPGQAARRTGELQFEAAAGGPAANAGFTGSTYEGELKFYLGEIAKGIDQFAPGRFRWRAHTNGVKVGDAIIERMARLYYDMLSGHEGWAEPNDTAWPWDKFEIDFPPGDSWRHVSRASQAFQLAVNTATFAMPRWSAGLVGFVDGVRYKDGTTGVEYFGYGPQPYISELLVCYEWDDGAQRTSKPSLVVELFNPYDPQFANRPASGDPALWQGLTAGTPADVFALPAEQFAVSVTDVPPNGPGFQGALLGVTNPNPAIRRLNGRCFYTVAFSVTGLNERPGALGPIPALEGLSHSLNTGSISVTVNGERTVYLWRRTVGEDAVSGDARAGLATDRWQLVDQQRMPDPPTPQTPQDAPRYRWKTVSRDTSPNRQFGAFDFVVRNAPNMPDTFTPDGGVPTSDTKDTFARWNVVLEADSDSGGGPPLLGFGFIGDSFGGSAPKVTLGNHRFYQTNQITDPDTPGAVTPNEPTVPLILMNAGPDPLKPNLPLYKRLNNLPMFGSNETTAEQGDLRPRSFPTPGFLLFVPRYATTRFETKWETASEHLRKHWRKYTTNRPLILPPLPPPGTKWPDPPPSYTVVNPANGLPGYPADFGHMPVLSNFQRARHLGPFDDMPQPPNLPLPPQDNHSPVGVGSVPWGLLVFDYFTTLDPAAPGVDPLRVQGRINVNTAAWDVLSLLPLIGPAMPLPGGGDRIPTNAEQYPLPIRRDWPTVPTANPLPDQYSIFDPSPTFWDPAVGGLVGEGSMPDPDPELSLPQPLLEVRRLVLLDDYSRPRTNEWAGPEPTFDPLQPNVMTTRWRLGNWLAASAAAYRDGVQYVTFRNSNPLARPLYMRFADSHLRNAHDGARYREINGGVSVATISNATPFMRYRDFGLFGEIRGFAPTPAAPAADGTVERPTQFGFVSIGELLNVKGFDSTRPTWLPPYTFGGTPPRTTLARGDFVKAVSVLALLDTQMLTTRSNTFSAYVSVMDQASPERSVRMEMVVDRSNLLPRLSYTYVRVPPAGPGGPGVMLPDSVKLVDSLNDNYSYGGANNLLGAETPSRWTASPGMKPNVVSEKRTSYFNARFDD
ncbi:MAG: hypothetical protein HZB38_15055 [Planctomycetes bacterium]|nr:hypothetical protein [Planctomycetota bacterium]